MFSTEKQLVQVLKSNFSTICDWHTQDRNTFLSEEVDLGFGVADLVISRVKELTYPEVLLNSVDVTVYTTIRDNSGIRRQDIIAFTNSNTRLVKLSLIKLTKSGFICESEDQYTVSKKYEAVTHKNIAIEAKLKNWKRALSQAFRYKWFASETYVVMDSCYAHTAIKYIDEFIKLNVGLAEINVDGVIVTHHKPDEEIPLNSRMTMILNERVKESLLASQV